MRHPLGCQIWWLDLIVGVIGFVTLMWVLLGCSTRARALEQTQQAIQDCILAGGHPRVGPGQIILCD